MEKILKNLKKSKIIISSILSGSDIIINDVISEGDIIVSINDVKVYELEDIVKAIDETYEKYKGYAIIKNHNNNIICLQLTKSLLETLKLSLTYNYKWKNPLTTLLLTKIGI